MRRVAPRLVVYTAVVAFVVTQFWMSERIGSWSEETSTYPSGPHATFVAGPDGAQVVDSCAGPTRLRAGATRPVMVLCAGGRTWPILGTSYTSTWPYWAVGALLPFDVFALRKLSLLLGVLSLMLGYEVARRLADARVAAAGVAVAALSSPFVVPHCLLVHFELLQLPLVVLAARVLVGAPDRTLSRSRAVAVGALAGLAIAVNVKSSFLIAPLLVLAWRRSALPTARPGALAALCAAALVPLVPMIALDLATPAAGLSMQVASRVANVVSRVRTGSALLEPFNCVRFWTDIASYGEQATGRAPRTPSWTFIVPAASLVYVGVHFVRALAKRTHDALAATLGALIVPYVALAALLWDQVPAANYSPLHAAFGFASAVAAMGATRWLRDRMSLSGGLGATLTAAVVALCVLGAAWNTFRTGDPARQPSSTNAVAQQATVRWLETHPGGRVVTLTYNLAGVLDGASAGDVRTTDARPSIDACSPPGAHREADPECVADTLAAIVHRHGPVQLVVPHVLVASDERSVGSIAPALRILSTRGRAHVRRAASMRGVATPPLIDVWEVRP